MINLSFHLENIFSCWTHITPFLMQVSEPRRLGLGPEEAEAVLGTLEGARAVIGTLEKAEAVVRTPEKAEGVVEPLEESGAVVATPEVAEAETLKSS